MISYFTDSATKEQNSSPPKETAMVYLIGGNLNFGLPT